MSRFYSMLRAQMMKAQVQQDPAILRELIQLLFSVREAWVELNNRQAAIPEVDTAPASASAPAQAQSASWKA
jgi:flagellin-specific chaperone FliS